MLYKSYFSLNQTCIYISFSLNTISQTLNVLWTSQKKSKEKIREEANNVDFVPIDTFTRGWTDVRVFNDVECNAEDDYRVHDSVNDNGPFRIDFNGSFMANQIKATTLLLEGCHHGEYVWRLATCDRFLPFLRAISSNRFILVSFRRTCYCPMIFDPRSPFPTCRLRPKLSVRENIYRGIIINFWKKVVSYY